MRSAAHELGVVVGTAREVSTTPSVPGPPVLPGPIDGPESAVVLLVTGFEGNGEGRTPLDGDSDPQLAASRATTIIWVTTVVARFARHLGRIATVSHATGRTDVTVDTMPGL